MSNHPSPPPPAPIDEPPGVPGFRRWRNLYVFVLGCFVLYVVLLALFSRAFS